MKSLVKTIFILFSIVYLAYLALPNPQFLVPPPDSLQSNEPADSESPLRRAYFTDFTREEVLTYYQEQMKYCSVDYIIPEGRLEKRQVELSIMNQVQDAVWCRLSFLTYRLNYPPEEAYGIIRDQTRSTFLEEIVHPFRESVFVNGFEPKNEKDTIIVDGRKWRQKITIKYVPSNVFARLGVGVLTLSCIYLLYKGILFVVLSCVAKKGTKEGHS